MAGNPTPRHVHVILYYPITVQENHALKRGLKRAYCSWHIRTIDSRQRDLAHHNTTIFIKSILF